MACVMFCGYGECGKDTAADFVKERDPRTSKIAFADSVREFAFILNAFLPELGKTYNEMVEEHGYEEAKKFQPVRNYLVKVGQGARDALWGTVWIDSLKARVERRPNGGSDRPFVVPDCRYKNEAEYGKARGKCVVVRIERVGCEAKHETERLSLGEIEADVTLRNDGSKEKFFETLRNVLFPIIDGLESGELFVSPSGTLVTRASDGTRRFGDEK